MQTGNTHNALCYTIQLIHHTLTIHCLLVIYSYIHRETHLISSNHKLRARHQKEGKRKYTAKAREEKLQEDLF